MPSGRKLLIFDAAARNGSFSAAAREFNLTQPSVSRSIAEFEQSLGVLLFHRNASGLELTTEGKELYLIVRDSLAKIEQGLRTIVDRNKNARPVVSLSLSSSFVMHWLVPRLGRFQAVFPDVDLRFDLVAGVIREVPDNVDLAARIVSEEDERYERWNLAPEIILPVCSPGYLQKAGKLDASSDGSGHVFLTLPDHGFERWGGVLEGAAGRDAIRGTWLQFSDYGVILQAALNGEGIALGWMSVISRALIDGTLVPASSRWIDTGKKHQLVRLRNRSSQATVKKIALWLVDEMKLDRARLLGILPEFSSDWAE